MKARELDHDNARRSCQGPAWRWQYALELSQLRDSEGEHCVDEHVRSAAGFIRMLGAAQDDPSKASSKYPIIAQAKSLWDTVHSRQQFSMMTLADFTRDAMSQRLNMEPEVIEVAELLFFDIRECRQASAWIEGHVIRPESQSGHVELATRYRMAYWGGAKVAEWILDTGKGVLHDSVERIAEQERLLQLKFHAAAETPINTSKENLQFLKMFLDYRHRSARLEFEKEKFRTRAEQEIRKYELAELRQRNAEKRYEQQVQTKEAGRERRSQMKKDRERLAAIQASIQEQRLYSEQQKRIDRVNQSPLGSLFWKGRADDRRITRDQSAPPDVIDGEQQDAAA